MFFTKMWFSIVSQYKTMTTPEKEERAERLQDDPNVLPVINEIRYHLVKGVPAETLQHDFAFRSADILYTQKHFDL